MKRDSNSGKIVWRTVGIGPVALCVLAALAVILLVVSRSRAEFVCGDHNGDDQVAATDAQLVLRHAVDILEPPLLCPTVSCTTTTVVVTTTSSTTTTLRYCCGSASIDPEATLAHLEAGVEHRIPLRVAGVPFSLLDLQCSAGDGGGQFGADCGTSQGIMIPAGGVLDTEFTYLLFDDAPPLVTITVETTPHSPESSCGSGCTVSDYRSFSVERTPLTTTTTTTSPPSTCPPTTTTTLPLCGDFLVSCAEGLCPDGQECSVFEPEQCGCTGPPVPCGEVYPVGMCSLGECPAGEHCRATSAGWPDCFGYCACF